MRVPQFLYSGVSTSPGLFPGQSHSHLVELVLEVGDHGFLDDAPLLVQVLDYVLMVRAVDVDDDRLHGRVALDQDACGGYKTPGLVGRRRRSGIRGRATANLG